ncbi:hypothetical protein N5T77_10480 [Aliarcobacter cryaerophilus]|uniref:type II secretion system protein GspD n=1 Tax=Aliarcobacter cryaerophilus TaxID=28198 RepID=UPI0021B5C588|nr:hypothetical protein [Aliarcobacter cryaerophilus]MCT7525476.1 hypothetical protein [Aliarcobacter cryaerophilus]
MKNIVFVLLIFLFGGCSLKHEMPSNTMISEKDMEKTKINGNTIYKSDKDEGLFLLDDGKIYVKTDGRSLIDIIDEIAFKKRLNYTLLTNLPNTRLKLANKEDLKAQLSWKETRGKIYNNINELISELVNIMNYVDKTNNYEIIIIGSGLNIVSNQIAEKSYSKIFLYNTKADDVKAKIDAFYSSGAKPEYSIVTLPSQNALIIQAKKTVLEEINSVIIPMDSNSPQVLIEAQVFEYDDNIGRLIGTSIERVSQGSDYKKTIKTSFSEGVSNSLPTFFNDLTNTSKKQSLLYSIAMQDSNSGVTVIAEPRVVLKPGTAAELKMETKKYVIVSGVNDSSLQTIDTGIVLKITPIILSEKTILLNLELVQSDFIPTNEESIVQSINKNSVLTSVVAYDGELISIGGIYVQKTSDFDSGIPYLKDIPVLGFLFGSQNKSSSRIMIEFMIKPSIKNIEDELNEIKKNTYQLQKKLN